MDFWTDHLKNSDHSWITTHPIWERLCEKKTNDQYEDYFFEDEDKRGFLLFTINKWSSCENHIIYFAYTIDKYRKQGVLKNLLTNINKYENIIAEVNSEETKEIWQKLGFKFYRNYGHDILLKK